MARFNKYEQAKDLLKELGFFTKWNRQVLNSLAESIMAIPPQREVYLHVKYKHVHLPNDYEAYYEQCFGMKYSGDEESWIAPRRRRSETARGYKSRLRAWLNLWAADVLHEFNPVSDRIEPCEVISYELLPY